MAKNNQGKIKAFILYTTSEDGIKAVARKQQDEDFKNRPFLWKDLLDWQI